MVVRELKGESTQSMHSQWPSTMMTTVGDNNDDSSSSCSETQRHDGYQRKRRGDPDMDDDKDEKRRKNREAAKRCREKKQQQTEDLKEKNGELEKENCDLAKQRDELIQKCREYQREIEQHREQGCKVPHFNPPYDLSQILHPSSPPSPSFSESAPSTSSCPSPTPSLSPGPSSRHMHTRPDMSQYGPSPNMASAASVGPRIQDGIRGIKPSSRPGPIIPAAVTTLAPAQTTQPSTESSQSHFLRVRNKDGSHKVLKLDHENYLKVMQRLRDQRAAKNNANQAQASASMSSTYPTQQIPASQLTQPQQMLVPQVHSHSPDTTTSMNQLPVVPSQAEEQETVQKCGQKLDTCEDLLSILKSHVKDNGKGFELMPVDPEEVPIKQEPEDTEYQEPKHFLNLDNQSVTGIKQEDRNTSDSSGAFISTGQQIRAGLDAITNKDDPSATSAHIQNIVQYLEGGKQTVSGTGPMVSSVCFSAQAARQKETVHTVASGQAPLATYVTSSSSMGSLSKVKQCTGPASSSHHQATRQFPNQVRLQNGSDVATGQRLSIPQMQNVTLRLNASNRATPTSMDCGETLQTVSSSAPTLAAQGAGQLSFGMVNPQVSQGNITTSSSIILDQQTRPFASSSPRAMMSVAQATDRDVAQQQMSRPKMQGLQQGPAPTFQLPTSTTVDTSALGPLQLQTAPTENLMSESTSQITEYLMANSIESLDK